MFEVKGKSILVRVSEGSSYRESAVSLFNFKNVILQVMSLTFARYINIGNSWEERWNSRWFFDPMQSTMIYTSDPLSGPRLSPVLIPSNRSRIFVFQSTLQIDPSHDQHTEILKLWHKPPRIREVADELDTWLNIASLCICFFRVAQGNALD